MVELIQELLLSHNCVIIPGFGALIGNYSPSDIRPMEHKIVPPNKIIAFNRLLQANDGLLINALAKHASLSYKEAEAKVFEFSKDSNESLALNKSLILKDIGRFTLDEDQKILFQPFSNKNYLLNSFGLESLSLVPIQRLKDTEKEIRENYQRVLHPEFMQDAVTTGTYSRIPYWITAVMAVLFLTSTLTWNIHKTQVDQSCSSLLPAFEHQSKPVQPAVAETAPDTAPAAVITTPVVPEPVTVNTITIPAASSNAPLPVMSITKAYIVVGAFFDDIHANKVKAQVEAKGYIANISTDYNNTIFRVNIEVETQDLSASLQKIKSDFNQRAWVFCTNCQPK